MDIRDKIAARLSDDFRVLEYETQREIVGRDMPRMEFTTSGEPNYIDPIKEHIKWEVEGRARWLYMKADAMIREREKWQES